MEISATNIEGELGRLWDTQTGSTAIKACLFNLIVYTHEPRRTDYFQTIVRSIIEKFPCRIIFIQGNRDRSQDYLKVQVSAETIGKGSSAVACEQIVLQVAGKQYARVPYLILPHFVPDLPIYLLWGQDPTKDNEILPHLQAFASRLVFDSDCSEDLSQFSKALLRQMQTTKLALVDMNWTAISGWRDVLAKTFDSKERIDQLSHCKEIKIVYNETSSDYLHHPDVPALYLQAWLAAQLEWKLLSREKSNGATRLTYQNKDGMLNVTLSHQNWNKLVPGAILSVDITGKDNHFFSIIRSEDSPQAFVHISTKDECGIPFSFQLPSSEKGKSLMNVLFFRSNNAHYTKMLGALL